MTIPYHCQPSDFAAMLAWLARVEAGDADLIRNADWRTRCGVLATMLRYALRDAAPAPVLIPGVTHDIDGQPWEAEPTRFTDDEIEMTIGRLQTMSFKVCGDAARIIRELQRRLAAQREPTPICDRSAELDDLGAAQTAAPAEYQQDAIYIRGVRYGLKYAGAPAEQIEARERQLDRMTEEVIQAIREATKTART